MRVNIVVGGADLQWIAGKLARELVNRLPAHGIHATINGKGKYDLEYQQIVYGPPTSRPAVGLFTHDENRALRCAPDYDGWITLNPRMQVAISEKMGKWAALIEQAVDCAFARHDPIVFGVAGSTKAGGRKGEQLVQFMMDEGYTVIGYGSGWPCPIVGSNYSDLKDLRDFYQQLDYYVVTSEDEGGCTPIIECMALGIPVISPKIGFAIRRPVLEYEAGNWTSLKNLLHYLTHHRTYDDWAHDHAVYFREVLA